MTGTEQKILDAALKIFAKKGYDAATTRVIAEESGYTEMTLFRKFGTKKNLFEQVMEKGNKKMKEHISSELSIKQEFKNSRDFLTAYIKNLNNFMFDNFEFFHLSITEENKTEPILDFTIEIIVDYIDKNISKKDLNSKTFGFSIFTYLYSLNIDRYYKRTSTFEDYDESLKKLVDILYCMVKT